MSPRRGGGARRRGEPQSLAALVFFRSPGGRSLADLGQAALPKDLSAYRPPVPALEQVVRFLESKGFRPHKDELGLTLSFDGPPTLFAKVFGLADDEIARLAAPDGYDLAVPAELRPVVERIVTVPPPELF